jgi:hypothetical protein
VPCRNNLGSTRVHPSARFRQIFSILIITHVTRPMGPQGTAQGTSLMSHSVICTAKCALMLGRPTVAKPAVFRAVESGGRAARPRLDAQVEASKLINWSIAGRARTSARPPGRAAHIPVGSVAAHLVGSTRADGL